MTRIRSASPRISSRSEETSRIAAPAAFRASNRLWIKSAAPISTPRVGSPTIRHRGWRAISRAQRSFCWLPPDSEPAGAFGAAGRMSKSRMCRAAASAIACGIVSPPREKGGCRWSPRTAFSAAVSSVIRPVPRRSSGIWARPSARRAATPRCPASCPAILTEPRIGIMPASAANSSDWPLPATPATPTISPLRTWKQMSQRLAPFTPVVARPAASSIGGARHCRIRPLAAGQAAPDHQLAQGLRVGCGGVEGGNDPPRAHDADPVGHREDFAQFVGDEQHRPSLGRETAQHDEQPLALVWRQHRGRLVEDQDIGARQQRFQYFEALAQPDRQGAGDRVGVER